MENDEIITEGAKEPIIRMSITIPRHIKFCFQNKCDRLPMSGVIEDFMKEYTVGNYQMRKKHFGDLRELVTLFRALFEDVMESELCASEFKAQLADGFPKHIIAWLEHEGVLVKRDDEVL